jgi:hypothetical protein
MRRVRISKIQNCANFIKFHFSPSPQQYLTFARALARLPTSYPAAFIAATRSFIVVNRTFTFFAMPSLHNYYVLV